MMELQVDESDSELLRDLKRKAQVDSIKIFKSIS